jgi:hypothetical protein
MAFPFADRETAFDRRAMLTVRGEDLAFWGTLTNAGYSLRHSK